MRIDIMLPLAMTAVLMTATIGGSALAADRDGDREAAALQGAKVSLTQAIATAEGQTGGRAIGADVSQGGGRHPHSGRGRGATGRQDRPGGRRHRPGDGNPRWQR